jgi:hypothetical protein
MLVYGRAVAKRLGVQETRRCSCDYIDQYAIYPSGLDFKVSRVLADRAVIDACLKNDESPQCTDSFILVYSLILAKISWSLNKWYS